MMMISSDHGNVRELRTAAALMGLVRLLMTILLMADGLGAAVCCRRRWSRDNKLVVLGCDRGNVILVVIAIPLIGQKDGGLLFVKPCRGG